MGKKFSWLLGLSWNKARGRRDGSPGWPGQVKEGLDGKETFLTEGEKNTAGDQKVIAVGFKKFIIYIGICYN